MWKPPSALGRLGQARNMPVFLLVTSLHAWVMPMGSPVGVARSHVAMKEPALNGDPNDPYNAWSGRADVAPFGGAYSGVGAAPQRFQRRSGPSWDPAGEGPSSGGTTIMGLNTIDGGTPTTKSKQPVAFPAATPRTMQAGRVVPIATQSASPPTAAPTAALNLAGKVALIKDALGLDSSLNIASAIRTARQEVGLEIEGNLNEQADALLSELI